MCASIARHSVREAAYRLLLKGDESPVSIRCSAKDVCSRERLWKLEVFVASKSAS